MGIKGIFTLFVIGGIAGAGYYFRDGIKSSFADGTETVSSLKDKLQDGAGGNDTPIVIDDSQNNNKDDSKQGSKDSQIIYVPIYQNNGQISEPNQNDASRDNNKSNPTITQYIKNDKKKTSSSISNTFSSPWARDNQDAYAKKKYGIDYDTLSKAVSKTESKRTITEKKQIENAKALEVWDSRSINNW